MIYNYNILFTITIKSFSSLVVYNIFIFYLKKEGKRRFGLIVLRLTVWLCMVDCNYIYIIYVVGIV